MKASPSGGESFDNTYCISGLCSLSHLLPPSNKITMASIGPFFFILGLVVASVTADETSTRGFSTTDNATLANDNATLANDSDIPSTVTPSITANITTNITMAPSIISISITTSATNIPSTSSPSTPTMTNQGGDKRSEGSSQPPQITKPKMSRTTPKPIHPSTASTTKAMVDKSTIAPSTASGDSIAIIILVVIILIALGFGIACYFARKRGRRYSVDFTSRPDEANIPLSTVEPELPVDSVPQNGLKTFESLETTAKEPQEPEAKPEVQEEQKAEADKSVVDPSAESAAPAPSPDSTEDKPKGDVVEQGPPAPVGPSVEEKTDDEGGVSSKTSVESLKETNENNSNNADLSQQRDFKSSSIFWDISLDCPV